MQQLLPQLPRKAAHSYSWVQTTKIKSQDRKPYALSPHRIPSNHL